jgi:hypothetical protein
MSPDMGSMNSGNINLGFNYLQSIMIGFRKHAVDNLNKLSPKELIKK